MDEQRQNDQLEPIYSSPVPIRDMALKTSRKQSYLPNPSARVGYDTWSILKRSLTGLNSEFSFSQTSCLTKAEEPSPSYYLPIAGRRIIGFIPFPRVLVLCETKSVSSRIWTRVAVFISNDDNHYTTGTSRKRWTIETGGERVRETRASGST